MTVTFAERGGKTDMVFRQEGFKSVEERDGHSGGWSESLERLVAYLQKVGEPPRA